eukprot:Awhi_evm1s702
MSLTKLFVVFNIGAVGALGTAYREFGKGPYIVEEGDVSKSIKGLNVGDRQGCQQACEKDSSCVGYFTYVNPKGYFYSDTPPLEDQICRLMVDSSVYDFIGDNCDDSGGAVTTLSGNLDRGCIAGSKCEFRNGYAGKCLLPETKENKTKPKDDYVGNGVLANGKKYSYYDSTMVIAGHNDVTFDVSKESTLNKRWTKCAEHCGKTKKCKAFEVVNDKKKCYLSFSAPWDKKVELKDDPNGFIATMDY